MWGFVVLGVWDFATSLRFRGVAVWGFGVYRA